MSQFTHDILVIEQNYIQAQDIKAKIDVLISKLDDMNNQYVVMLEAQQLLTTVSDENTTAVLDYITGIINKTLGELFPHDSRRIYLEKTMYQGQHAHINIKLTGTNGKVRDLQLQSGTGLRQVISFLFVLSLIEIRKGRRLLLADELLSGLHPEAKRVVQDIITIFAEEGFQFAFVEYGVNDLGKIYLVEKPNDTSTVTPMDGVYNNEVFVFNRPPEDVDLTLRVEEGEDRIEA
jgi:hypothetical protein